MQPIKKITTRSGKGWKMIDTDRGFLDLMSELEKMKDEMYITTGVHEDTPPFPNGESVAYIALINEKGTTDGRIPARSFLGSTFDRLHEVWTKENEEIINDFLLGVSTIKKGLKRLGLMQTVAVKETITKMKSPANAASTIRKKGFDNPLIHTRRLRNSINYEVHGD